MFCLDTKNTLSSSQIENPKVFDIALIRLSSTVPVGPDIAKRISPVLLPGGKLTRKWPPDGAACIIVGWGCTKEGWYPSGYEHFTIVKN